ncbi:MAG: hypothetical protein CMJ58_07520 [Planctomycetaceae bacterium]|nr:hypothetical protein [Planctomycetaceae bacterium]
MCSSSQKVMIVDDERAVVNGLRRLLGTRYDLRTAQSGPEALAALETEGPFALVVTDMMMPKMSGLRLIRQARELAPQTVYIMLTGNQDRETADRARDEGRVFRFLRKPCENATLIEAIEAGLQEYASRMAPTESKSAPSAPT